ncbi:hypothetical protein RRF57_011452 [Xylaria bambusicola]|uniref:Uncharacterized protein n=1 Tax=Xylaria bambusicola TaxID=326684 RepID=A0AAN7UMW5_9PEZI
MHVSENRPDYFGHRAVLDDNLGILIGYQSTTPNCRSPALIQVYAYRLHGLLLPFAPRVGFDEPKDTAACSATED